MDREKVIKELETIKQFFGYGLPSTAEMFDSYYGTLNDAIAILQEQEAKPMIENELGWSCRSCGMTLIGKTASGYPCDLIDLPEDEPIHFCPKCGQAVKWE